MPEHIVVRDPHIQGTPRSAISFENCRSFNSYFSKKNKAPFFHLGLSQKLFPCTRDFHWKVFGFVPSVRILILPKLPKGANTSDSCLYRNHVSVTKDFICSIKISSGNFLLLEGEAIELLNILIVASES